VLLNDETRKQGKLTEVNDDTITIEEKDGKSQSNKNKQAINKKTTILFNDVKHTKVLVTF